MGDRISAAFGIFSDRLATENAIEVLRAAGFRNTDISSLFPDEISTRNSHRRGTMVFRGAATGAAVGAFVGGVFGWLVGTGAVSLPAISAISAIWDGLALRSAAPLVTFLVILGAASAVGTVVGALAGRRFPEYQEHYEGRVRRGDILVSVHCDDSQWAKKAMVILKRAGAEDIVATDKAAPEFMRSSRPAVPPAREKTVAAVPLRLVVNNRQPLAPETSGTEVRTKSAAS